MRAAIVIAGCFIVSSVFAAEQAVDKQQDKAKPAVVAKARTGQATRPVKTEVEGRVWTLEMSCCEPQ
jgi:hypothetical protein